MENNFFKNKDLLEKYSSLSQQIGARAEYVQGGGGNTSVKLEDGLMAIKASGFMLSDIKFDKAFAVMDYSALQEFYFNTDVSSLQDAEKTGSEFAAKSVRQIEGLQTLRPSVEAGFHSILQRFVCHTHSVYANFAACAVEGREIAAKALEGAPYSYGYVSYTDPGVRLTFLIRDEVKRVEAATGKKPSIIIMQNHGIIATDDSDERCLEIHEDANMRIADQLGKKLGDFPQPHIRANADGTFSSDTPWLTEKLASGKYDTDFFIRDSLYPDQIVFLNDCVEVYDGTKVKSCGAKCAINSSTGNIVYNMSEKEALVVEQTLTAILFIVCTITEAGFTVSTLGDAAKDFIANWESEKYRKSLSK